MHNLARTVYGFGNCRRISHTCPALLPIQIRCVPAKTSTSSGVGISVAILAACAEGTNCHDVNTGQASESLWPADCRHDVRCRSGNLYKNGKFGSSFAQTLNHLSQAIESHFYCPRLSTVVASFASLSSVIVSRLVLSTPISIFQVFQNPEAKQFDLLSLGQSDCRFQD